jgi:hypothetical protein
VGAFPKSIWERGEAALAAQALLGEIAERPVHTETATVEAYGIFAGFYRRLGLRTTPLHEPCAPCREHPWETSSCNACRGGKKPLLADWKLGSRLVEEKNVGVVTGSPSGFLVGLDFDRPELVRETLRRSPSELANLTLVVRTWRGYHIYVRQPEVPNMKLMEGIDVRGEGGLLVAPPSVHAAGIRYEFLAGRSLADGLIAPARKILPPDLYDCLVQHRSFAGNTNTPAPPPRAPVAPAPVGPLPEVTEAEWREVCAWMVGSPKLSEHWRVLLGERPPLSSLDGGRSRSDFVAALALAELALSRGPPWGPAKISAILQDKRLKGSKACERGADYADATARKAFELKQRARGPFVGIERSTA